MPSRTYEAVVRVRADTRQAQQGMQRLGRGWQALSQWSTKLRAGMMGMNTMLIGSGAVMVGAGIAARSAIRNYEQYSRAQARIRGILASSSADISYQRELMQQADASSRQWGHGLNVSAEAMGTMLETGLEAHEAVNFYGVAAEFARAANTDLEGSTRVLVDAMRQFDDISTEGARNLASTITVASRISSTSVEELQQSLRYAGVELSAVGYEADETAAALGAMSAIGLRGTTAGTRLRGAILALTRITGRSRDIMREYGLEHERLDNVLTDEQGNLRTMTEMTEVLGGIFEDLPTHAAKLNLATALFGRRAYAAGVVLAGLHERSDEFRRVLGELSDEELNQERMQQAAEEQMRSFAAQMDLARRSAQELGVSFMEMLFPVDDAHRGFGSWLNDLSLATRAAGEGANMTEAMRAQYEQLSPEMQQAGRDTREIMEGLVELLRVLAQVGRFVGRLVAINPQLAMTLLFVGSAVRPLIPLLWQLNSAQLASVRSGLGLTNGMRGLGAAGGVARFAMAALITDLAGRGSIALTNQISGWMDLNSELDRAKQNIPESVRAFSNLPVIGPWVEQVATLVELAREAEEISNNMAEQRRNAEEGREAMAERAAERGPEAQQMQTTIARDAAMMRAAATLYVAEARSLNSIASELERQGFSVGEAAGLAPQLLELQQTQAGRTAMTSETFATGFGQWVGRNISGTLARVANGMNADIFRDLRGARERYMQANISEFGPEMPDVLPISEIGAQPSFEEELIDILGRRAYAASVPAQQVAATPQGRQELDVSVAPTQLEVEFNLPVIIDGREVGRAVGQHVQEINERRGTAVIGPGSRRRTAEQGVP